MPLRRPQPVLLRRRRRRHRRSSSTTSASLGSIGDLLGAGIAIAMAFCGCSSVASAGRMLFAFSRDDGLPGSRLAEEGLAPLPDAGQRADRDRRGRLAVHRVYVAGRRRRPATAIVHHHRDQHDLPVRRLRRRASTSGATTRNGSRSGSGAWAAGPSRSPGWRSFWVVVLMVLFSLPDVGQHLVPVHGRDRASSCSSTTSAGRASRFQGPKVHGRRGRADRDRARVRAGRPRGSTHRPDRDAGHDRAEGRPARRPALATRRTEPARSRR